MAFAQKLAGNVNAYGAQTQQLMQQEVARIKNDVMHGCECASNAGKCSFSGRYCVDGNVCGRQDYQNKKMRDLLQEGLADLGFQRCEVQSTYAYHIFDMSATWTADAETSRKGESIKPCSGGTRVTCPICNEHRPAVALVPCGHVVCRECRQKLHQCPMCRKVITSATQGLFMDWPPKTEVPPLGVSAVGIPASAVSKQGGVTYFGVDVVPETRRSYRVQKRYNDFDQLKDSLNSMAPGSRVTSDFPPKHLFSCEGPKLEDRRHGLERWLTGVLNDPHSRGLWCLELRGFLEVGGVHTLPDQAPPLAASAPAASAPGEPEGQVLQIPIPAGVSSGQTLSVTVPGGQQLNFTVPPGMAGRSKLQLRYDPVAGTVSPLV